MNELGTVLLLALVPAAANLAGGVLSEVLPSSGRLLSAALHLATGIVIAVIGLELMPRALEADPAWAPLLAFIAGAGLFLGVDRFAGHLQARSASGGSAAPYAIYSGTALDLFSDGILIGTGTVIDPTLGLLLALGQAPADLPEGFATTAALRRARVSRRGRLISAAAFALPVLTGAALGYLALRDAPDLLTLSVLAFTGGALLSVVIEEMIPEAHEAAESRWDSFYLVTGFALFAAVTTYLG
ncbi:ZIP family metal transporter [Streptomyces megasporus]|uniref:ZIP family metal transporter n=1 Tax=Streptomyces megasporus TaxID=44060 RepID=UPI0004E0E7A9|nr:ZIP family metal transporter [Streptomyces megasporus]